MLLIMISDQYPNYYKAVEVYTGYIDSLDIVILFSSADNVSSPELMVLLIVRRPSSVVVRRRPSSVRQLLL